jgi:hypothetical protein
MAFEHAYTPLMCRDCLHCYTAILLCDDPGHWRCPACKGPQVAPHLSIRRGDLRIEGEVEVVMAQNRRTTRKEP